MASPQGPSSLSVVRLKYRAGDLIMKQGDYGVSVYKIVNGRVQVTKEREGREAALEVLGPGEVFGETVFLNKTVEVRSVSARAVEDVELEVWHPGVLRREYDRMSPVLKYITDQMLERLDRMKKLDAGLTHKRRPASLNAQAEPEGESKRRYRRRPLNLGCVYRPEQAPERVLLNGRITDISLGGIGMEVAARNTSSFNHRMNDKLFVLTNLPGGRKLEFAGRIRSFKDEHGPGRVQLGVEFTDLDGEASKALRFFMMS